MAATRSFAITQKGVPLVRVSVAVKDRHADGQTEWVNVALFGEQSEDLALQLTKGTLVHVEGRLKKAEWLGADGVARSALDITAFKLEPLAVFTRTVAAAA